LLLQQTKNQKQSAAHVIIQLLFRQAGAAATVVQYISNCTYLLQPQTHPSTAAAAVVGAAGAAARQLPNRTYALLLPQDGELDVDCQHGAWQPTIPHESIINQSLMSSSECCPAGLLPLPLAAAPFAELLPPPVSLGEGLSHCGRRCC
jgi:hypothetical protein